MFAGKIKLTTFLVGLGLLLAGTCGVGSLLLGSDDSREGKPTSIARPLAPVPQVGSSSGLGPQTEPPVGQSSRATSTSADPTQVSGGSIPMGMDQLTREVLSWQGRNIQTDKLKDAAKGSAYKLNVYQDSGEPTVNRVKVDLDRDEKWDEKYTFKGTEITRQVAPADDEQYTLTFHWQNGAWVPE